MPQLILTRPAEPFEAAGVGMELCRTRIGAAFTDKSELGFNTLDTILKQQSQDLVQVAALSVFNQFEDESLSDKEQIQKIRPKISSTYNSIIREKIREDKNVLMVIGGNILRASILVVERAKLPDVIDLDVDSPTITTYELTPHMHMLSKSVERVP
jgi:bisphosphoglycerate-dependent phosphoglycerate mutase